MICKFCEDTGVCPLKSTIYHKGNVAGMICKFCEDTGVCPDCRGQGYDPNAIGWQTCRACRGTGLCECVLIGNMPEVMIEEDDPPLDEIPPGEIYPGETT